MGNRYDQAVNFVPAIREPARPRLVEVDPAEIITLPHTTQAIAKTSGTHLDRAKGFQVVSLPLAAGVGAGSLIVGIVGFSVPVFSVAALAWLWGGFLLTWLAAWLIHNLVSADGIALLHTILGWQYLRREQAERFKRYREMQ